MLVKGDVMKYPGIFDCWTCERLKRGECKKPVSLDKKSHGGCSQWENKELYKAWFDEFGNDVVEISDYVDKYLRRRDDN